MPSVAYGTALRSARLNARDNSNHKGFAALFSPNQTGTLLHRHLAHFVPALTLSPAVATRAGFVTLADDRCDKSSI
jgi:hypothetical protein